MCGICGIYNFDNSIVTENEIHLMNEEMYLRGPDDSGIYVKNNLGMGMRRLSIIDLDKGQQPMISNDKNIIIVFNGEIYNYVELREELKKKNYKFLTNSDTEVLIYSYQEYGENFLKKLNGMFSICIYDKKSNTLIIARDRFGIKPLYFFLNQKEIIFASSIKSIKKKINKIKISKTNFLLYLSLNYVPNSNSIYGEIKKLKPAQYIKIKNKKIEFINYWTLPLYKKKNTHEFNEKLKYLFENSIKIQSRSDVEVGAMLSGGLDSSLVSILFSKNNDNQIKTFCVDFFGKYPNEGLDAKEVANKIKSQHIDREINQDVFFSNIKKISGIIDEPISDSAIIPSFIISEMANKQKIKVILSGAGGDELFGGYSRHYHSFKNFFHGILKCDSKISNKIYKILPKKLQNYFLKLNSKPLAYISQTSGINITSILRNLRNEKFQDELIQEIEILFNPYLKNQNIDHKEKIMRADLFNYLPDNILSLLDKTTMMNSLEARVPFLDHRIVEHIFENNSEIFEEKKFINSKSVLKKIFKNEIPDKIIKKKKIGFNAPLNKWHQESFKNFEENFSNDEFYNQFFIKDFHEKNNLFKKENTGFIFSLSLFDEWLKQNDT